MSGIERIRPQNPVELASVFADQLAGIWAEPQVPAFQAAAEEATLIQFNVAATRLEMLGTDYLVESMLAFKVKDRPQRFGKTALDYQEFEGDVRFQANLCNSAVMKLGKLRAKAGSVQALCLAFDAGEIYVPGFEEIQPDEMLYVPPIAVRRIESVV